MPDTAHEYRLNKITEIQKDIEREKHKRSALLQKYHRAVKVIEGISTILLFSSMGLGVAGIGILSTIVAAPVAIAMEGIAVGTGFLSMVGSHVNKKLSLKVQKHEKIRTLAEVKLNTISGLISKALKDEYISDEEYSLILSELQKFNEMKKEIRSEASEQAAISFQELRESVRKKVFKTT